MTKITAADVNKLRKMTGAGMMDCKNALVESDGDFEKAVEILRKKGQKVAAKRADREASEGIVISKTSTDATFGAVVMVNSETDFVGKSEDFVNYAKALSDLAISRQPKSLDELKKLDLNGRTVEENLTELIGKTGEKLQIGAYECIEAAHVSAYNHLGNRLATLVGVTKNGNGVEEVAHDLAMQVAAMNPLAIDKEDVDQAVIDKEIEIGMEQARQDGKPEAMLEKIAKGKLNKFFQENTLLNQAFIKDNTINVRQYIQKSDQELKVTAIKRVKLGE
jgi:elongation factor Ts